MKLAAAVRNGDLDIAFLGVPDSEPPFGVETVVLDHDEHVLVVPAGHRLADASQVTLHEIAEETFVDFVAGHPPEPSPMRRSPPRAWCATSRTKPASWSSSPG